MDAEFERRQREGLPPFDGLTVESQDYVPLPDLRRVLNAIVDFLAQERPDATLYRLKDWHEHDECVSDPSPSSWEELKLILVSDEAIYEARTDETVVSLAFFPAERDYYFRFHIPSDYENPLYDEEDPTFVRVGSWDFTGPGPLVARVFTIAFENGIEGLDVEAGWRFFDLCRPRYF